MQDPGFFYQDILDRDRPEDRRKAQNERVLHVLAVVVMVGFIGFFMADPYHWAFKAASSDPDVQRSAESYESWRKQHERDMKELEGIHEYAKDYMRRGRR